MPGAPCVPWRCRSKNSPGGAVIARTCTRDSFKTHGAPRARHPGLRGRGPGQSTCYRASISDLPVPAQRFPSQQRLWLVKGATLARCLPAGDPDRGRGAGGALPFLTFSSMDCAGTTRPPGSSLFASRIVPARPGARCPHGRAPLRGASPVESQKRRPPAWLSHSKIRWLLLGRAIPLWGEFCCRHAKRLRRRVGKLPRGVSRSGGAGPGDGRPRPPEPGPSAALVPRAPVVFGVRPPPTQWGAHQRVTTNRDSAARRPWPPAGGGRCRPPMAGRRRK